MDWSQVWPTLVASLAGVVAAAAFTRYFTYRADEDRKLGVRALLSSEMLHNATALTVLQGHLDLLAQFDDSMSALAVFRSTAKSPQWQRTRWNLPDVGGAVALADLLRLTEWYKDLDQMTYLYDNMIGLVIQLDLSQRDEKTNWRAHVGVQELKGIAKFAGKLVGNMPPLPDKRFDSDSGVKRYYKDLADRQTAPATGEHDEGA
jgi:hypothetical protein